MSILIKGAKPPGGCAFCYFNVDSKCALIPGCNYDETNGWQRRDDCPLVELPEHGDLVDMDYIKNHWPNVQHFGAPVVIPAERSWDQFHPFADSVKMGERSESADKCTKCKYYDSETYSCNDAWLPEGVCPFVERSER